MLHLNNLADVMEMELLKVYTCIQMREVHTSLKCLTHILLDYHHLLVHTQTLMVEF